MRTPLSVPAGAVIGIGLDVVEVPRIRRALGRWRGRFAGRVFAEAERRYCEAQACAWPHFAVRFAAKEAVAKALGTGIGAALGWRDIEVVAGGPGCVPQVRFSARGRALLARRGVGRTLVSLSHTREVAAAQAILLAAGGARPRRRAAAARPGKRRVRAARES